LQESTTWADGRPGGEAADRQRESLLRLVDALRTRVVSTDSPLFRRMLADLFEEDRINFNSLVYTAAAALKAQPEFGELIRDAESSDFSAVEQKLNLPQYLEILEDPLLHRMLRRTVVRDFPVERLLTILRRIFLAWLENGRKDLLRGKLRLMVSVASQCFNNEYVYGITAFEEQRVEQLKARLKKQLENGDEDVCEGLAIYGMYAPLWTLGENDKILNLRASPGGTDVSELVARQVQEHIEEETIQKEIRSFGMSGDEVTNRVRQQYEESPYPRWMDLTFRRPGGFAEKMEKRFPFLGKVEYGSPVKILVAGCGTGSHPILTAAEYSDVSVVAIDISKPSLAYAIRQARRYGVSNIEFIHGDLLCVEKLGMQFDVIESAGVLHHLADPGAGLRALMKVLRPGGIMEIGIYSRRYRQDLEPAMRLLDSRNANPSPNELRANRQEILASPIEEVRSPMRFGDFYYLSGVRDLLCPAHALVYTPAELKSLLSDLHLTFLGYRGVDDEMWKKYGERFPEDPDMRDLDRIDQFDADYPTMLGSLQEFCARKDE
jgi:2-polyprenyl-3-methyl-5-hydroxy-6-metoxy-1,4-benzoquinol methylase